MPGLLPDVDPDGLLEYSVVYTDRAVNHMSKQFQGAMKDISRTLKQVYNAHAAIVVPGSGTFGMEAVARQFGTGKHCMVIRNGWFSYRWTQIFDMGAIPEKTTVLTAKGQSPAAQSPFAPPPVQDVVAAIREQKPDLLFAAHVETASGIMLPPDYLRAVADAIHAEGGLFVLDCIASGAIWVDMVQAGVDVLISAPQKGWSGPACAGLVMLSERARTHIDSTTSTSFSCDLRKWLQIMEAYEQGGFAYHATMPTDALITLRDVMAEAESRGFESLRASQQELGDRVRAMLREKGFVSVAAPGFEAPGVVVCYTDDDAVQSGRKFTEAGIQAAAGVPLQCGEPEGFKTFRIGLFGLDKWANIDRSVQTLERVVDQIRSTAPA